MNPQASETRDRRAAARRTQLLAAGYLAWSGQPWLRHATCLVVLFAVPLLRWWPALTSPELLGDEPAYRAAFLKVAQGESPYEETDFVYPAVVAFAGAWSAEHLGIDRTLLLLRAGNLAGLAIAVWCSLAWLPWSSGRRLLAGCAFVLIAPQVAHAILLGNLSLAASGLVIAGLLLVPDKPRLAASLLGASLALKPIAPMVVPCLLAAPDSPQRRSRLIAASGALVLALGLLLAFPYAEHLLVLQETPRVATTVSLHRLPSLFGLEVNALWISGPLALVALAALRRVPLGRARFLCVATTSSLVVLPLVWSHTLLLALPLEVLALTVALDRLREGPRKGAPVARPPWLEPVLVVLAVASLQFAAGAGGIDDQNLFLQAAGALLPALAPVGLLAYLMVHTEAF